MRVIAKQRPARADAREQIGAILEAAAADDACGRAAVGQAFERTDQSVPVDRPVEHVRPHVGRRDRERVLIAEGVRHQRHKAAAPRGGGERSSRDGGDQHHGTSIH
jgi:hypothetical protein